MHFCADELNAIVMCVPLIGAAWVYLRSFIQRRRAIWRTRHREHCVHGEHHRHWRF